MRPSTLSVIAAALSSEGFSGTHAQIEAALSVLVDDPAPQPTSLRPGETVVVWNENDGEVDESTTLDEALQYIKDSALNPYGDGTFRRDPSDYRIFIVRKELEVKLETCPTASWAE